jgi:hypothetical protein
MNNLENKEILPDNILSVMLRIVFVYPDCLFGGSIALNGIGLISRPISDIDIFIVNSKSIPTSLISLGQESDGNVGSDTVTDINGVEIQRTAMKINDVKVCVFKVPEHELSFSLVKFTRDGITYKFKIQHVNHAINAKRAYLKTSQNPKHEIDLKSIEDELNFLFN